jgi:methyl-accepting chemotaxis protein
VEILSLFYPISDGNETIGALQLMFTTDSLRQYRWESMSSSLLACGIGLIVLIVLVYFLLSRLFNRIQAVVTKMNTIIQERDLTQRVVVESRDEIGELGDVFNKMVERLFHLTQEIQRAGLRVTSSTEQIVDVARSHLEAAEDLLRSLEEAKTGIEALKKLANQISGKAETVLTNAEYTLRKTIRGVEVVEELVTEMNDIDEITREGVQQVTALNKEAQQITEIVTIIEDITANTKLIAFNATVEAARAGESGKGFSVVANEIRNLADSVGVATSNIRKIIQGMQDATTQSAEIEAREKEKVEHVLQSVQRTKDHLDMVLRMLDDTVNHARDISLATEEQKVSNDRIFEKMQEFFEIAQFAKVRSADTSASARELDRLAEELQATVEQFKLD